MQGEAIQFEKHPIQTKYLSMDSTPVIPLRLLEIDKADDRLREALIAHVLFGWTFWKDATAVILRPPETNGWTRTNFHPNSVEVDLHGETQIRLYADWDRGGALSTLRECLAGGIPRWSKGNLLNLLIARLCDNGISMIICPKGQGISITVSLDGTNAESVASTAGEALVHATSKLIAIRQPDLPFPKLPNPS